MAFGRKKTTVDKAKAKLEDKLGQQKNGKSTARKVLAYITLVTLVGRIVAGLRARNAQKASDQNPPAPAPRQTGADTSGTDPFTK